MKLLSKDGTEVDNIDFGMVEVGTSKTVEYQLYNEEDVFIDMINIGVEDTIERSDITISEYTKELSANSKNIIAFTWTPSLNIKKGLQLKISLSYRKIWK